MYKILFLGSNPSQKSSSIVPFWNDARSTKVLNEWIKQIGTKSLVEIESIHYLNVANYPTPGNRPLKDAEIKAELDALAFRIYGFNGANPDKIIALGRTAESALKMLGIEHYPMPHPSGLNRLLNDPQYVAEKLNGLKEYLKCPTVTNVVDP